MSLNALSREVPIAVESIRYALSELMKMFKETAFVVLQKIGVTEK